MRKHIVTAAVVLSLGAMGIALGQPQGEPPKAQVGERAKLRAQIISLRGQIELLEIEHDVDRTVLIDVLKEWKDMESKSPEQLRELAIGPSIDSLMAFGKLVETQGEKKANDELDESIKKGIGKLRAMKDHKSQDFIKQAEELAGMRIDLAEAEALYNESQ